MVFTQAEVSALAGFLADVGTVLTSATGWISTVVGVIMDTPVLLVPISLGIALSAIGIFNALRN